MNQDNLASKFNLYLISVVTIVLCGELYFFPFQGDFRFSAGVVALSIILLLYEDIKGSYLAPLTGISVLLLRCFIYSIDGDYSLFELININIPASIYYITYVILFYIFKIRLYTDSPARTIYLLAVIDASSNITEALIRGNLNSQLIRYIIIVAIARSAMIYVIFRLFKRKELLIKKQEHQKKYNQLNTLISNIQSEIFYLKKSTVDIEGVMTKAYAIYEKTKDNKEINGLSLDVARDVHEIKKDYDRVINGFKSYIDNFDFNKPMSLNHISTIIESNLERYIEYQNKEIKVSINFQNNLHIKHYYYIFTIINNLITNAIDAIINKGQIEVESRVAKGKLIFKISDNGPGIDDEIIPYIFSPGFTTKYDPKSGTQSTGIGLSHVEYIVKSLDGTIEVESQLNKGTSFTVTIPVNKLRR